jgi:hypothetical protein
MSDTDEERRLARRQELKLKIVERRVQKRQTSALRSHLAGIHAQTDDAEREYQTLCKPLQAELREIDAAQVASIMAGELADPAYDERRLEIVGEVERHASLLETVTKSNEQLAGHVQRQIAELGSSISKSVALENSLVKLAGPALLDEQALSQSRQRWAGRRLKAAAEALENSQTNLRIARQQRPNAAAAYESRLRLCELESEDARRQVAESTTAMDALRRRMLDE